MMPDLQTRVTGAPPVGISDWLARPAFLCPKRNLQNSACNLSGLGYRVAMTFENIIDTRDWEKDEEGISRPLKGSGEQHACDHCGALHEIHVILRDGDKHLNIGTTCVQKVAPHVGHLCSPAYLRHVKRMREIYGDNWKPR